MYFVRKFRQQFVYRTFSYNTNQCCYWKQSSFFFSLFFSNMTYSDSTSYTFHADIQGFSTHANFFFFSQSAQSGGNVYFVRKFRQQVVYMTFSYNTKQWGMQWYHNLVQSPIHILCHALSARHQMQSCRAIASLSAMLSCYAMRCRHDIKCSHVAPQLACRQCCHAMPCAVGTTSNAVMSRHS